MDTVAGTSNGIGRKLLWVLIAILGAVSLGIVALSRGETISAAWLVIAAVCVYLLAYRFYALFIADRVLGIDPTRLTPATRHNDGLDYVPTNKYVLFGHHFAAIAGAAGRHPDTGTMAFPDLKDFLPALEKAGELKRVPVPVDPDLEISEIVQRVVRAGGPALLFERPTRGEMPLVINLFGAEETHGDGPRRRAARRDRRPDRRAHQPELPVGWSGIREGLGKAMQLRSVPPKKVKTAPCQELVIEGDAGRLQPVARPAHLAGRRRDLP